MQCKTSWLHLLLFTTDNNYLLHAKIECGQGNPVIISCKGVCEHNVK